MYSKISLNLFEKKSGYFCLGCGEKMFFELFSPTIGVLIFASIILIVINLFYRFLINQSEAEKIKNRINELNNEMKTYKDDKNRQKELMSEILKENNKIMRMTLKPMLISFIIVILFLPFLAASYGDKYVLVNNTANVTIDNEVYVVQKNDGNLQLTGKNSFSCSLPCRETINAGMKSKWNIKQEGDNIKFERIVALLPFSLPFFGDDLGWIAWYLITSIPLMILIRKMMGIKV